MSVGYETAVSIALLGMTMGVVIGTFSALGVVLVMKKFVKE